MIAVEANGTAESIYLWGKKAFKGDKDQERTFQILTAKFVLTYVADADSSDELANTVSGIER